jgi:hypothetical protein
VGQLGGCGEYWMGRVRVVYFYVRSSEVVAPVSKFDYILAHMRFMGFRKLSSFDDHRVGRYLISPVVMYIRIVYGPPSDSLERDHMKDVH